MTKITIIGAGLLGTSIAKRLSENNFKIKIWNRSSISQDILKKNNWELITDINNGIYDCDYILTLLSDGPATLSVLKTINSLKDKILICMSTTSIDEIKLINKEVLNKEGKFLESPMLGSRPEAECGKLIIFTSGDKEIYEKSLKLLNCLSSNPKHIGAHGKAMTIKLSLNHLIGMMTYSFSNSLHFIKESGINEEKFMEILRISSLYAPNFDKKLKRMITGDFYNPNFTLEMLLKDLILFNQESNKKNINNLLLEILIKLLNENIHTKNKQDYSSIFSFSNKKYI